MLRRHHIRKIWYATLCAAAFGGGAYSGASAQNYPDRLVRVVSTTPSGGAGDVVMRLVAERVSRRLKQAVVIEAQPAAAGQVATQAVVRAEPDGYSLLWGNSNLVNTQVVRKNLPFDVLRDLTPISLAVELPFLLFVNSSLPFNTLEEFVRYARARPGELAYGSVGVGSGIHLAGESLGRSLRAPMTHIPYASTGVGTLIADLSENRIQVLFSSMSTMQSVLDSGKVKVLAVSSKDRYALYPQAQPIAEVLPDFIEVPVWFGMLGPARTPKAIIDLWSSEIRMVLHEPEVKLRLDGLGLVGVASNPEQMGQAMQAGITDISALVKDLKL